MSCKRLLLLSIVVLSTMNAIGSRPSLQRVSLCSIQENPDLLLNTTVEVKALMVRGFEISALHNGRCRIRYAFGDDYQTFGNRFRVKRNGQWDLMRTLLNAPNNCSVDAGRIHARIRGTVIRILATGIIPDNEMPVELVIQSVAEVEPVPIDCASPSPK